MFCWLFWRKAKYTDYRKGFAQGSLCRTDLKELSRLGVPIGFQMGVESASFSLSVIMMGWLGSAALAAHFGLAEETE